MMKDLFLTCRNHYIIWNVRGA